MEKLPMCRICLVQNVRMNLVVNRNFRELYEKLTDIPFVTEDRRPILVCFFCCAKLKQCCRFQKKCLEAEELFAQMMNEDYEPKSLINQDHLEFLDGFIKSPIVHVSIVDGCQTESIAIQELPAVCEGPDDIIEPKEEHQSDELKLENFDNSCLNVADIPPHNSESDFEDVPLMEFKTAVEEEQEVSKKKRKAREQKTAKDTENSRPCLDEETQRTCKLFVDILETSTAVPFRFNKIKYRCFYCPQNFYIPSQLKKHTQMYHMNEDLKVNAEKNFKSVLKLDISELQCKICFDYFEDTDTFVAHLQKHKLKVDTDLTHILSFKLSDDVISCYTCKKEFVYFSSLYEHTQLAHTHGKYSSETLSFCTENSLARDVEKEHKTTHFDCDVCGKKFYSNYNKLHHIRRMHEIKYRKCPVCFKILGSAYQKRTHLAKVHNIWTSQHKCDICPRIFLMKSFLTKHIRREHFKEKNMTCDVCGQRFFDHHLLESHQVKHDKSRPFECVHCKKTFTRKKALDVHERIHTNDKRCVCKECGKAFVQHASLHWHMRLHRNEKAKQETGSAEEPTDVGVDE